MNDTYAEYLQKKGVLAERIEYVKSEISFYSVLSSKCFLPSTIREKAEREKAALIQELQSLNMVGNNTLVTEYPKTQVKSRV